ncbi:MAG TPA: spore coat U domain-containing protein [Allosphingosinicella sp.]|jgi:spore coat protein U-like protein
MQTTLASSRLAPMLAAAGALLGLAVPTTAMAGTQNATMNVSATVTANCTISTTPIAFGSVNTLSGNNVDANGTVSVTCTNGSPWTLSADAGGGSGATMATRRMTAGGNTLNYTIHTTAGHGTVWGDGTATTATIGNTGTGSAQTITVYGRVFSGQTGVPAGSYADTVNVTVTY